MGKPLETMLMTARSCTKRGDYAEAERLYRDVLGRFPRNERARRAYTPDEVREQLHARYARAASAPTTIAQPSKPTLRERVSFLRRKKSRA